MKKASAIIITAILSLQLAFAANEGELKQYRRNSIATMMIFHAEDEFGKDIMDAFLEMPMPDKYDDHNTDFRVINFDDITGVLKDKNGLYKSVYGKSVVGSNIKKNAEGILSSLESHEIAKLMVATWFNLKGESSADATFDMELIKTRGQYDATEMAAELARNSARGYAILEDAGEELLNHTFVLVNDLTYITAEERAEAAKIAMSVLGALIGGQEGKNFTETTSAIADSFTGFTVKSHSYLYQLEWNDSIETVFYENYYTEKPDPEKIEAFLNDKGTFRLKYVEHQYEADTKSTLKGSYDRHDLVKIVCARSVDNNIAALQQKYNPFKVKMPVYSILTNEKGKVEGYAVQIGLKEGVNPKSTYQVIQRVIDPKTNKTKYKYVATIKPVKGKIWDNRYMAAEEQSEGSDLKYTTFKKTGGGEIMQGMLVVEGKYVAEKEE